MKRKTWVLMLSVVMAVSLSVAIGAMSVMAAAVPLGFEKTYHPVFTGQDFTPTTAKDPEAFNGVKLKKARDVGIVTEEKFEGDYSIDMVFYTNSGGATYALGALGYKSAEWIGTMDSHVKDAFVFAVTAGGLHIPNAELKAKMTLYDANGAKLVSGTDTTFDGVIGNVAKNATSQNWFVGQLALGFDVHDGKIDVYVWNFLLGKTAPDRAFACTIGFADDVADDLLNGSFAMTRNAADEFDILSLTYEQGKTFGAVDLAASLAGDTSFAETTGHLYFADDQNAYMTSTYAFTKEGLTADTDAVFDITWSQTAMKGRVETAPYGLLFGQKSRTDTVETQGVSYLKITKTDIDVYTVGESGAAVPSSKTVEQTLVLKGYLTESAYKLRLVGYKNGKVELYMDPAMQYLKPAEGGGDPIDWSKPLITYENVDVEGYVSFYSLNTDETANRQSVFFKDVTVKGNASVELTSVEIDESVFTDFMVGDEIELSAKVNVNPSIGSSNDVTWAVTKGADVVTLGGSALAAVKAGEFEVTATSVVDPTKKDTFAGTVGTLAVEKVSVDAPVDRVNIKGNPVLMNFSIESNSSKADHNELTIATDTLEGTATATYENGLVTFGGGAGKVKITATSVKDSAKKDEFVMTVVDEAVTYEKYENKESFDGINECDWTLTDGDGNVTANSGLIIANDYKTEAGGSAKVTTNIPFAKSAGGAADEKVFDITFTSGLMTATDRTPLYSWGLLFGMPNPLANAGDEGVGYLRVDFNHTEVYVGSKKITPEFKGDWETEAGNVYFELTLSVTVRVVGTADGKLTVYRGYSIYESIDNVFAVYDVGAAAIEGFAALTTDSEENPSDVDGYSVMFSNVVMSGNTVNDGCFSVRDVTIDKTSFPRTAIIGEELELGAVVNVYPNQASYRGATWSVVSGPAEITAGGKLKITGEGEIKVRATSAKDATVVAEHTFSAIDFKVTGFVLAEGLFDNVTNDTQPIDLRVALTCNSTENRLQAVTWQVVSGPAEIVLDQLRITGVGEVKVKVTSVYDADASKEYTFTVADADAGQDVVTDPEKKSGCKKSAATAGGIAAVTVALAAGAIVLTRKK